MSSQKGNVRKSGGPKHKNTAAFKNSMHDTSKRTQVINDLVVSGTCARCKEIVDWKIKYKKYKPLSQAKKCVKCQQKTVKKAYYIVCQPCSDEHKVCAKCSQPREIVIQPGLTQEEEARQQSELNCELRQMSERKRRTFFRSHESGKDGNDYDEGENPNEKEMSLSGAIACDKETFDEENSNLSDGGSDNSISVETICQNLNEQCCNLTENKLVNLNISEQGRGSTEQK